MKSNTRMTIEALDAATSRISYEVVDMRDGQSMRFTVLIPTHSSSTLEQLEQRTLTHVRNLLNQILDGQAQA